MSLLDNSLPAHPTRRHRRVATGRTPRTTQVGGRVLAFLAAAALATAAQAPSENPLPTNPPTSPDILTPVAHRKVAPDFTLTDSDGSVFRLGNTRGKVVVLNFWATWCGGCKFELPYFVAYDQKYHSQGLTTLGISMDDGGFPTVKPFWAQKHMPYPTVVGNEALANSLGLKGMPFTLLIDRHGRIAIAHAGVLDRADFDRHIQQLLQSNT